MHRTRLGVILVVILAALGSATIAVASHDDGQVIMKDDCDAATFNAAIGPGTCVGNGKTTFADFRAQLIANGLQVNRSAKGWAFRPGQIEIEQGQALTVLNKGGETHSFSPVAQYGGGCVAILNQLLGGLTAVPECGNPAIFPGTLIPAGGSRTVSGLSPGLHRFECLIHPWMRTDVMVEPNDENDDDDD